LGPTFLSVSSNHEFVSLVPGPPGVSRATDIATKTQLSTKAKVLSSQYHLMQVGDQKFPSVMQGQSSSRCTYTIKSSTWLIT